MDSVSGPLEVAVQLATRYEACELLEPSIALTRFTLRQVELVLERDDDEYLGRSWKISEYHWNILEYLDTFKAVKDILQDFTRYDGHGCGMMWRCVTVAKEISDDQRNSVDMTTSTISSTTNCSTIEAGSVNLNPNIPNIPNNHMIIYYYLI